jgi:hypothetical protein
MPVQLRFDVARVERNRDEPLVGVPPVELVGEEDVAELGLAIETVTSIHTVSVCSGRKWRGGEIRTFP